MMVYPNIELDEKNEYNKFKDLAFDELPYQPCN